MSSYPTRTLQVSSAMEEAADRFDAARRRFREAFVADERAQREEREGASADPDTVEELANAREAMRTAALDFACTVAPAVLVSGDWR